MVGVIEVIGEDVIGLYVVGWIDDVVLVVWVWLGVVVGLLVGYWLVVVMYGVWCELMWVMLVEVSLVVVLM